MADNQLLEGVDIFVSFPQTALMLIPGQLRVDSSFKVAVKVLVQMLEPELLAFLHIDVRTGCSDKPSKA